MPRLTSRVFKFCAECGTDHPRWVKVCPECRERLRFSDEDDLPTYPQTLEGWDRGEDVYDPKWRATARKDR